MRQDRSGAAAAASPLNVNLSMFATRCSQPHSRARCLLVACFYGQTEAFRPPLTVTRYLEAAAAPAIRVRKKASTPSAMLPAAFARQPSEVSNFRSFLLVM